MAFTFSENSLLNRKTLLGGASALVLAATAGLSGAFANTYNAGTDNDILADGTARTTTSNSELTNVETFNTGDNLKLNGKTITIDNSSNDGGNGAKANVTTRGSEKVNIEIGTLSGAGALKIVTGTTGTAADIATTINKIEKSGATASDVKLLLEGNDKSVTLTVGTEPSGGNSTAAASTVRNLTLDATDGDANSKTLEATFWGVLTVEGTTQVKANSSNDDVKSVLSLRNEAAFNEKVTLTGGDDVDNTATLDFQGGSIDFKRGLELDKTTGDAIFHVKGVNSMPADPGQVEVKGAITAAQTGDGAILVDAQASAAGTDNANLKIVFLDQIGESGKRIGKVETQDGRVTFKESVYADTVKVSAGNQDISGDVLEVSDLATFEKDVTAKTLDIGNAATFKSNVGAATVNVNGNASFAGNLTIKEVGGTAGTSLVLANAKTATFDGKEDQTVTGKITGTSHIIVKNAEKVDTKRTVTFKGGDLGASDARLGDFELTSDARTPVVGQTHDAALAVVFEEKVYGSTLAVSGGSILSVNRNSNGDSNPLPDVVVTFEKDVNFLSVVKLDQGAKADFKGKATLGKLELEGGATAIFEKDFVSSRGTNVKAFASAEFKGGVDTNGMTLAARNRADLKGPQVTFHQPADLGSLVVHGGSRIVLGDGFASWKPEGAVEAFLTVNSIVVGGNATKDDPFIIQMPASFVEGEKQLFSIALDSSFADGGNRASHIRFASSSSADYAFKDDRMTVIAKKKSVSDTAARLGISLQVAQAEQASRSALKGDARRDAAVAAIAGDTAKERTYAEQVSVQTDAVGGAVQAAVGASSQVAGVNADRLSALRSGAEYAGAATGFATGDQGMNRSLWLKPFGSWAKQSDKGNAKGFSSKTRGLAGGFDVPVGDNMRGGLSVAWSNTDVTGKGAGNSSTDVDSYQVSLYGDYTAAKYYIEGQLGYGRNHTETRSSHHCDGRQCQGWLTVPT